MDPSRRSPLGAAVTWRLHGGYMAVAWRLHGGYMAVTWRLHAPVALGCRFNGDVAVLHYSSAGCASKSAKAIADYSAASKSAKAGGAAAVGSQGGLAACLPFCESMARTPVLMAHAPSLHPRLKQPVGGRLAHGALRAVYGW